MRTVFGFTVMLAGGAAMADGFFVLGTALLFSGFLILPD